MATGTHAARHVVADRRQPTVSHGKAQKEEDAGSPDSSKGGSSKPNSGIGRLSIMVVRFEEVMRNIGAGYEGKTRAHWRGKEILRVLDEPLAPASASEASSAWSIPNWKEKVSTDSFGLSVDLVQRARQRQLVGVLSYCEQLPSFYYKTLLL